MIYTEMTDAQKAKIDADLVDRAERVEAMMARTPIYSAAWWRLSLLYEQAVGL